MTKISSIYHSPYLRREIYSDAVDDHQVSQRTQQLRKSSTARYGEYAKTKITFGKHKGKWLSELPIDYIKWGIMNLDDYRATMFSIELQRRDARFRK